MRLILKILAILILAPFVLGLLLVAAVAAIVGVPLLWEKAAGRYTSPGEDPQPPV